MLKYLLTLLAAASFTTLSAESFQVDFSKPAITITQPKNLDVNVTTGPMTYFNSYYKESWILHGNGQSFIRVGFNNHLEEGTPVNLRLVHLSSISNKVKYSPITIKVNGAVVVSNFSPEKGNYCTDSFDITQYVKKGTNTIRISLDDDAQTNYWISHLGVNFKKQSR